MNSFAKHANPMDSDNEDDVIFPIPKVNDETDTIKRHYLHVPYQFKDDVKMLGAKFDKDEREWYVLHDITKEAQEPMVQDLIDTFHKSNFYGMNMNKTLITFKKHQEKEKEKYNRLKEKYEKYYRNQDFDFWYDQNINLYKKR